MTARADTIRDRRRAFAAPGGSHDRLVSFLAKALPAGIGAVLAVMILAPLFQHSEISFLLDRKKVAITDQRISVDKAIYRGTDSQGRAFSVSAGNAVQASSQVPIVQMNDLIAKLLLADGPAELTAPKGDYNFDTEQVTVAGPVNFTASDGYRMTTRGVAIDLNARRVVGSGGVEGTVPTGTFAADRIQADLGARTVTLEGNARLRMTPGKLRMPN